MAYLSNDRLLEVLNIEGVTVREYPGWRTLCRCHSGSHQAGGAAVRPFAPVGVMPHITGGGLGKRSAQTYIRDIIVEDATLPLKSQFVTEPDGTVWIVSGGRCNHAGGVSQRAVSASSGGTLSTTSAYQDLRGSGVDGNRWWYGIENIAASRMTAAQEEASVRICAAISRALGRSGRETIGHGEASNQRSKADPNLDMGAFRARVIARVKAGPSGVVGDASSLPSKGGTTSTSSTTTSTSTTTQEDTFMALTTAQRAEIVSAVTDGVKAALLDPSVRNFFATVPVSATYGLDLDGNQVRDTVGQLTAHTAARIDGIEAKLDLLVSQLNKGGAA